MPVWTSIRTRGKRLSTPALPQFAVDSCSSNRPDTPPGPPRAGTLAPDARGTTPHAGKLGSRKEEDTVVSDGMSTGTSSGRTQSAILLPVPEAEELVGPFRTQHDPVAIAGVPAHITLIVPWLPPSEIRPSDLADLGEVLNGVTPFDFALRRVSWFGRGVLWLAPAPTEPFTKLTAVLSERFATPPYEDEFDEIVPHLTVAHATDGSELDAVAKALSEALPIDCRAEQVWVMVGDGRLWTVRERYSLSAPCEENTFNS